MLARDILIGLHIYCNGNWDDMYYHITNKTDLDFPKILEGVDTSKYITLLDEDYPQELKMQYKPTFVLTK